MNSKLRGWSLALLLTVPVTILSISRSETPATSPIVAATQPAISIEPHFSPEEEIAPAIVKLIDNAQHSLDIAAFAFTHPDIANAVIRAHQRGVKVRMVMDMVNEREKNSLGGELKGTRADISLFTARVPFSCPRCQRLDCDAVN